MRRTVVIILCVAVMAALFGCGDTSQPSQEKLPTAKTVNDTYVEKAVNCWPQDLYNGKIMEFQYPKQKLDGTLFEFAQEYDEASKAHVNLYRVELKDGAWKEVEIPWKKKLDKELNSKNVVIDNYCYSDKGLLYLSFNEYSMYPKTYYNNTEKYYKDYYLVDQYWFRIDEKKGLVERLNLPKLKASHYYNSNQSAESQAVNKDQLMPNIVTVLKNGNVFVGSLDSAMSGLYSSDTCKKVAGGLDISQILCCTEVVGDDDYFILGALNKESGKVEICVYSQEGELQYKLPTDVAYDEEKLYSGESPKMTLGVADGEILLATETGIYRADFGDEQLEMIVDAQRDKTYYFSSENTLTSDAVILKGKDEDYYLAIKKEKDYGMDDVFLCHYTKA